MDKILIKEILLKGLGRHATQGVGGGVVATGISGENSEMIAAGLLLNAVAFGWSSFRKWNRRRKERKGK